MLEIAGASAFTPARLEKRLAAVRARNPGVTRLVATFTHFVDVEGELPADGRAVLAPPVTHRPEVAAGARVAGARAPRLVPRLRTLSPCASKATDSAHIRP